MALNENGMYVNPGWQNNNVPAINANELNTLSDAAAGAVEYDRPMPTLTDEQKMQALDNIGGLSRNTQTLSAQEKQNATGNIGAVSFANTQSLTNAQKIAAAKNIGAVSYVGTNNPTLSDAQKTNARTNIGAAANSVFVSVSVAAAAWSNPSGTSYYLATVTATGVIATSKIVVGIGNNVTPEQYEAYLNGKIICSGQGDGTITLKAFGTVPTIPLPVGILICD